MLLTKPSGGEFEGDALMADLRCLCCQSVSAVLFPCVTGWTAWVFHKESEMHIHMQRSLHRPQSIFFVFLIYLLLSLINRLRSIMDAQRKCDLEQEGGYEQELHEPLLIFFYHRRQKKKKLLLGQNMYIDSHLWGKQCFYIPFTQWEISISLQL